MKKALLGFIVLFAAFTASAQQKISEGYISYSLEWNVPPQAQAMAANLPTEAKVYFKGDSASMKVESQMFSTTSILNTKKEYERMLIDVPMMGKKFSVIFSPADQEKMADLMPQMSLKASAENKAVLGYQASKYTVSESKTNSTFEAWFTKDLDIVANPLSRFYDKSYGFPLEFTSFQNGMSVKAKVKEIKAATVPTGNFSASKDYEEISFDQLMQMNGRR
ncbi:MAG: hypothetical protein ACKOW2_00130 [Sphingobacteriaceae bacterium]